MESRSYAATESERPVSEVVVVDAPIPRDEDVQATEQANGTSGPISHHADIPRRSGSELFIMSTFILALIAWVTSLVGQAVVAATISNAPVRILWFAIIIQTAIIALIIQVLSTPSIYDAAYAYGTQISILSALATTFAVIGVDQNIYSSAPARKATGAGWLIAAIVDLLWILYFTSPPQSPILRLAASLRNRDSRLPQEPQNTVEKITRSTDAFHRSHVHGGAAAAHNDQLDGLTPEEQEKVERMVDEKMTAMGMYPRGFQPRDSTASSKPRSEGTKLKAKRKSPSGQWSSHTPTPGPDTRGTVTSASASSEHHKSALLEARDGSVGGSGMQGSARPDSGSGGPEDASRPESPAKWRAEALFEYTGSTDDPNELAFKKGDKLLVYDKSGKWWEAKTPDGRKGIAPSNYLRLV